MGEIDALDRRAAVAALLDGRKDVLVVTGLGSSSYDVMAAGDHAMNYYLWAAMGSAMTVGLGLAMTQTDKSVLVITGDGEALMGFGALATIAVKAPRNLTIAVLDNGHFGETGMQESHSARGIELDRVAEACTFPRTLRVTTMDQVETLRTHVAARDALTLATIKIRADNPPRVLPPRDGPYIKNRFREALGFSPI